LGIKRGVSRHFALAAEACNFSAGLSHSKEGIMAFKSIVISTVAALALSGTAWAHHSNAHFDQNDGARVSLTGEVVEYQLINPHAFIYLNVEDENGEVIEWALQTGGNVGRLIRANWSQDSVVEGDMISATLAPMRDGTPGGLLVDITLPDGTVLGAE
jgi:hypothetical protein